MSKSLKDLSSLALCAVFAGCAEAPVPELEGHARQLWRDGGFEVKSLEYSNINYKYSSDPYSGVYSRATFFGVVEKDKAEYNSVVSCSPYAGSKKDCRVLSYTKR